MEEVYGSLLQKEVKNEIRNTQTVGKETQVGTFLLTETGRVQVHCDCSEDGKAMVIY